MNLYRTATDMGQFKKYIKVAAAATVACEIANVLIMRHKEKKGDYSLTFPFDYEKIEEAINKVKSEQDYEKQ